MSKPNCSQCRHFFITWNTQTPHGCRRYGIQSREQPSKVVAMAGAGDCQGFEAKKRAEAAKSELDLNRKDLW
jgi:hypothetical protein